MDPRNKQVQPEKRDFKAKLTRSDGEKLHTHKRKQTNKNFNEEVIVILNIYAPNTRVPSSQKTHC